MAVLRLGPAVRQARGVNHPSRERRTSRPHDIGKNLVAMMLEGSGYEIVDLGVDVPADRFIQAIKDGANVVAMSALLTTTMTNMQVAIEAIKEAGLRDQVRIIIGGAPITKSYADEIGADGYAEDASSAVRLVKEVLAA